MGVLSPAGGLGGGEDEEEVKLSAMNSSIHSVCISNISVLYHLC